MQILWDTLNNLLFSELDRMPILLVGYIASLIPHLQKIIRLQRKSIFRENLEQISTNDRNQTNISVADKQITRLQTDFSIWSIAKTPASVACPASAAASASVASLCTMQELMMQLLSNCDHIMLSRRLYLVWSIR